MSGWINIYVYLVSINTSIYRMCHWLTSNKWYETQQSKMSPEINNWIYISRLIFILVVECDFP